MKASANNEFRTQEHRSGSTNAPGSFPASLAVRSPAATLEGRLRRLQGVASVRRRTVKNTGSFAWRRRCNPFGALAAIFLSVAAAGCGESSTDEGYTCEKDPELIQAGLACISTASCPCGTTCTFGRCEASCVSDEACPGGVCDAFGQCTGAGSSSLPLAETPDNYLQVSPDALVFGPQDEAVTLVVRLGRRQVASEVRISSSSATHRVACPGESIFHGSCVVRLGPEQPAAVVRVQRLEGSAGHALERFVQIRTAHRIRSLPIEHRDEAAARGLLRPGVFRGVAQLSAVVNGEAGRFELQAPLRIPVTVVLGDAGPRGHALSIADRLGILGDANDSTPVLIGLLTSPRSGAQVGFESAGPSTYLTVDHPHVPQTSVLSQMTRLTRYERGSAAVSFDLEQTLSSGPTQLRLSWRFALDETGELPMGFRRLDGRALPDPQASRQMLDTPWATETAWWDRMGFSPIEDPYLRLQTAICGRSGEALRFGTSLARGFEKTDTTNRPFVFLDGEVACARASGEPFPEEEPPLERWPLFPVFQTTAVAEDYEAVVVECLAELAATETVAEPRCVDFERWLTAASLGLGSGRWVSEVPPELTEDDIRGQRVGAYLVNRHLDVAGFLEQTFANQTTFRAFLPMQDPAPAGTPNLTGFVEQMTQARMPLLHPRLLHPLARLHPRALSQPDYRLAHARSAVEDEWTLTQDLHGAPILVGLVEDAAQRMQSLQRLAEAIARGEVGVQGEGRARSALQVGLRQTLALFALSQDMKARVETNLLPGVELFWAEQVTAAERILERRLERLLGVRELDRRAIEDLPLPWFRVGDQTATGARFRAMTDYFLGAGSTLGGVIGDELARGFEHEAVAIQRYQRYRAEAFRVRQLAQGVDVRRDDLAIKNGTEIIRLCGYDRQRFQARGAYAALQTEPNPSTCYIDTSSPRCLPSGRMPTVPEGALKLCRAGFLIQRVGRGTFRQLSTLDELPEGFEKSLTPEALEISRQPSGEWAVALTASGRSFLAAVDELDAFFAFVQGRGEPASVFADLEATCGPVYDRVRTALPDADCEVDPLAAMAAGENVGSCAPTASYQRNLAEVDADCFRGELGRGVLSIRSAELSILEAEAEFGRLVTDAEVAVENCNIDGYNLARVQEVHTAFIARMERLRESRTIAQTVAAFARATSGCLSSVQKIGQNDIITSFVSKGLSVGICAAEFAAAGADTAVAMIEEEMGNLEDGLDADLDILAAEIELKKCENNLRAVFAKLRPAGIRIREAVSRYSQSTAEFRNQQEQLLRLYDEGKQWEANLDRRALMVVPQEFDFLQRFAALEEAVSRVQRALIYAARAAEYELQQSVLSAEQIRQTTDILSLQRLALELRDAAQSGVVRSGGAATSARLILSLKDDILTVPGPGQQPAGFHQLPEELAFQEILTSPARRIYDSSGTEIGLGIRFTFSPEGLGDRETGLAQLLGGRVCAERVWSLGAVVVGEEAVPFDGPGVARMFLRKRNGFQSRRCGGGREVAGFIDPNSLVFSPAEGSPSAKDRYTSALLSASVWRGDLTLGARRSIEQGRQSVELSQEQAGWGLYGDYELFIPRESIGAERLRLDKVKDILLVFDLVVVSESI